MNFLWDGNVGALSSKIYCIFRTFSPYVLYVKCTYTMISVQKTVGVENYTHNEYSCTFRKRDIHFGITSLSMTSHRYFYIHEQYKNIDNIYIFSQLTKKDSILLVLLIIYTYTRKICNLRKLINDVFFCTH